MLSNRVMRKALLSCHNPETFLLISLDFDPWRRPHGAAATSPNSSSRYLRHLYCFGHIAPGKPEVKFLPGELSNENRMSPARFLHYLRPTCGIFHEL